jgi:hypothetical protein
MPRLSLTFYPQPLPTSIALLGPSAVSYRNDYSAATAFAGVVGVSFALALSMFGSQFVR